jgi:hypothetical protein
MITPEGHNWHDRKYRYKGIDDYKISTGEISVNPDELL